ncbi:MAG: hypothetical protein IJM17_10045 [Firmicutes bacterium]|nr:hypothetical protein [Bacillota bacterium]
MKVLFIGNSHTFFNDMPISFSRMYGQLTGTDAEVTMQAYGGRTLKWHYDEFMSLRFALEYGGYDCCVIQQQAHPFPGEEETAPYMEKIVAMCRSVGTEPVIYMPWAEKKLPENAARHSALYRKLAEKEKAMLAPVGELFERARNERPDIDLYFKDGEHASPLGDYMIACCFAALLSGKKDLSCLDSKGIDFKLDFEPGVRRLVLPCSAKEAEVDLDPEKTAYLRKIVEEALA